MKTLTKPTPIIGCQPDKVVMLSRIEVNFLDQIGTVIKANMHAPVIDIHDCRWNVSYLDHAQIADCVALLIAQRPSTFESVTDTSPYQIPAEMLYNLRRMLYDYDACLANSMSRSVSIEARPDERRANSISTSIRKKLL
jgi:hypothetical protein